MDATQSKSVGSFSVPQTSGVRGLRFIHIHSPRVLRDACLQHICSMLISRCVTLLPLVGQDRSKPALDVME